MLNGLFDSIRFKGPISGSPHLGSSFKVVIKCAIMTFGGWSAGIEQSTHGGGSRNALAACAIWLRSHAIDRCSARTLAASSTVAVLPSNGEGFF